LCADQYGAAIRDKGDTKYHDDERRLLKGLRKHKGEHLRFLADFAVPSDITEVKEMPDSSKANRIRAAVSDQNKVRMTTQRLQASYPRQGNKEPTSTPSCLT
jgi:hypothetical protein